MPLKPTILTTEADLLIKLVRDAKEIGMAAAAKELNLPLKTVEAWANFLEEERKLSIKYKLTTPYLVYIAEKEKLEEPEKPKVIFIPKKEEAEKGVTDFEEEVIKKVQKEEDVLEDPEILVKAADKLADLENAIAKITGASTKRFEAEIRSIKADANKLKAALKQKKRTEAERLYKKISSKISSIYLSLKNIYDSSTAAPRQEKRETNALIEKAYSLLKEGRVEEAKAVYEELKRMYHGLPEEFAEKRSSIERDLMKIHSKLSADLEKASMNELKEAANRVQRLINNANAAISRGDFKKMEALYASMKQLFEALPAGFFKEKKSIEKIIIRFYEEALQKKETFLLRNLSFKTKKIRKLLREIMEAIKKENLSEAVDAYNEVRELYAAMPSGFMKERIALQNEIIPCYEQLSMVYKDALYEQMMAKAAEIRRLLAVMNQHLDSNSLGLAETTYKQMQQIYDELPKGFLKEKTDVQGEMLKVYEEFISKSEIMSSQQIYAKIAELRKILKEAKRYLDSKDYELAEEMYLELMNSYNALPPGFVEEKTKLRNEILEFYKQITLKIDQPFLQRTSSESSKTYHEVIRTLLDVHRAIEQRRFESIAPNYNHIKILFNELPLGFVHKNMRLRQEIMKIYNELQLYKKVLQLDGLARKKDYKAMNKLLGEILAIKNKLAAECPEDRELFSFVSQKHSYYVNEMEKNKKGLFKKKPKLREIKPMEVLAPEPVLRLLPEKTMPERHGIITEQIIREPRQITETIPRPAPRATPRPVFTKKIFKPETFKAEPRTITPKRAMPKSTIMRLKEREEDLREIKRKIDELKAAVKPQIKMP